MDDIVITRSIFYECGVEKSITNDLVCKWKYQEQRK